MASANVSHYWVSPVHPGVGLLRATLVDTNFPTHVHDSLVIAVTESGGAKVKGRGDAFRADRRIALVFNPGEAHSSTGAGAPHWAYRGFYLRGSALTLLQEQLDCSDRLYFKANGFCDGDLVASLLDWHRALEGGEDRFAVEEKAVEALGLLYSRYGEVRPPQLSVSKNQSIVRRLVVQLQERFEEPLHLRELAQEVGLTQFQLISLFKASFGITPYSMLTQIRLMRACGLLIDGVDICEAAAAAGFYDQSALTKHFKRRFAVTPAQFVHARSN